MAENERDEIDGLLEAHFAAARQTTPPEALLARVLADAEAARPVAGGVRAGPGRRLSAPGGAFSRLRAALGGWPALAGLAAATMAGLWIGVAAPSALGAGWLGLVPGPEAGFELALGEG
jgi:hypothetical protein